MAALPLLDISDLRSPSTDAQRLVADRVDRALHGFGAFVAIGHGIPARIPRAGFREARLLFSLPSSAKTALRADAAGLGRGRGFSAASKLGGPNVTDAACSERFVLGADLPGAHPLVAAGTEGYGPNRWPPLPNFRDAVTAWQRATVDVTELLYGAVALASDLSEDHLAAHQRCPLVRMQIERFGAAAAVAGAAGEARVATAAELRTTGWCCRPAGLTVIMVDAPVQHELRRHDGTVVGTRLGAAAMLVSAGALLEELTGGRLVAAQHRWSLGPEAMTIMTMDNDLDYDTPLDCLAPWSSGVGGVGGFSAAGGAGLRGPSFDGEGFRSPLRSATVASFLAGHPSTESLAS